MKISKLFHWLYAFLMFLPIVLFIPNAFYYGFNEHATNSEITTINYKYQSNEVNIVDDLVNGNIYHFSVEEDTLDSYLNLSTNNQLDIYFLQVDTFEFINYNFSIDEFYLDYQTLNNSFISMSLFVSDNYHAYLSFYAITSDNSSTNYVCSIEVGDLSSSDFTLIGNCIIRQAILDSQNDNIAYLFQYTDYNVIESVDINTNDTISNKMYQAWQSTWNLPFLQWTHTSFVAQPFTYITGLFGVPSDSTLNYIFAYFVSISICWLVFDVIMYLPNLAHRWLDRGALE